MPLILSASLYIVACDGLSGVPRPAPPGLARPALRAPGTAWGGLGRPQTISDDLRRSHTKIPISTDSSLLATLVAVLLLAHADEVGGQH